MSRYKRMSEFYRQNDFNVVALVNEFINDETTTTFPEWLRERYPNKYKIYMAAHAAKRMGLFDEPVRQGNAGTTENLSVDSPEAGQESDE